MISETIRIRLRDAGVSFGANDCIAEHLLPGELDLLRCEVEQRVGAVLDALVIDREHDHNTRETAQRVAKLYLDEVFAGRYQRAPRVTDFPNAKQLDELYVVGPIRIRSACSHHLCPIEGEAWIGVIPSERVIGLSKFSRIAQHIMARPQIQEEATVQLADAIEAAIAPHGLAVIVRASHSCMTWRGVKEHNTAMTTSVMRGALRERPEARAELLALVGNSRFACS